MLVVLLLLLLLLVLVLVLMLLLLESCMILIVVLMVLDLVAGLRGRDRSVRLDRCRRATLIGVVGAGAGA